MDMRSGTWNIGWGALDWIDLVQDRDQWRAFMKTNEPSGSIKYWEGLL
jgi:hypothetical protein